MEEATGKPAIDVQNRPDCRQLPINKVGVKNVRYPIEVKDRDHKVQASIGTVDLFANLPHHFKGTHMSRFIEVFQRYSRHVSMRTFLEMLEEIRTVLEAEQAFGRVAFPYFMEKRAPVSRQASMLQYQCAFEGEAGPGFSRFFVSMEVPVMTLCPCSKEISRHGAHNQRSFCRIKVLAGEKFFWMEDLIELVESCASSDIFTLLKREDERFVTERSYENPVFVEDLVRAVTVRLDALGLFSWFRVEAENMESIHLHEAYACIERGEDPRRVKP